MNNQRNDSRVTVSSVTYLFSGGLVKYQIFIREIEQSLQWNRANMSETSHVNARSFTRQLPENSIFPEFERDLELAYMYVCMYVQWKISRR